MCILFFLIGLAVALLAHWPVADFLQWTRRKSGAPTSKTHRHAVPPEITGTFERLLAFTLVFFGVGFQAVGTLMAAWIAAKLAGNWHKVESKGEEANRKTRARTLTALMAGVLSIAFGIIGGLIARLGLFL